MSVRLPIAERGEIPEALPGGDASECAVNPNERLRVGDLAQRTQKTVRAIHLYEELGLLQPIERSKGGFRLFDSTALTRVRWISKLQEMGFSLPEIREVLQRWEASGSAPGAMGRIREIYQTKLKETTEQVRRLMALQQELQRSVDYLGTCGTCDPERLIHACPRCDLHDCNAPELVAGLHTTSSLVAHDGGKASA